MRYRTRPIEVDAWQHIKDSKTPTVMLPAWVMTGLLDGSLAIDSGNIRVKTVKGIVTAVDSDWIVREESGELLVYKPDVFSFRFERTTPNAS